MALSLSTKRQPRVAVNHLAKLCGDGVAAIGCTIIDVSHDGFRLRTARPVPCGTRFRLHCSHDSYAVEIRGASPQEAGGIFLDGFVPD